MRSYFFGAPPPQLRQDLEDSLKNNGYVTLSGLSDNKRGSMSASTIFYNYEFICSELQKTGFTLAECKGYLKQPWTKDTNYHSSQFSVSFFKDKLINHMGQSFFIDGA